MRLFDRYILSMTLQGFFGALGIISGLLIIQRFYRIIELAVTRSLGFLEIGDLVLWAFPMILFHAVPVSLLIGVMLGVSRLVNDSELCAMLAVGVGKIRLALTPMMLGLLAGFFALVNGLWLLPASYVKFDDVGYGVGIDPMRALKAGTMERIAGAHLGVGMISPDEARFERFVAVLPGALLGASAPSARYLILARSGIWFIENERLTLRLNDGTASEIAPERENRSLSFGRYTLYLPLIRMKYTTPKRMSPAVLLAEATPAYQAEFLRRLLAALAAPLFVLIAIPLSLPHGPPLGRRGGARAVLRDAVLVYLGFWLVSFLAEALVEKYGAPLQVLAMPQGLLLVLSLALWRRHW
jgi:lipopolysaccharide export LptBFGC system permease protein LptF